eukprot:361689-Chlamydomonas_euryale.AAC.3
MAMVRLYGKRHLEIPAPRLQGQRGSAAAHASPTICACVADGVRPAFCQRAGARTAASLLPACFGCVFLSSTADKPPTMPPCTLPCIPMLPVFAASKALLVRGAINTARGARRNEEGVH